MADTKIVDLTELTTPTDTDLVVVRDMANVETKKTTWANIKATLKTYLDTLYLSLTSLGTGVATALGVNVGSAGSVVVNGGALGTPSSGTATNLTGTATALNIGGNAATATALQTARTIGGVSFDGSANIIPQTIQSVNEATDTTCFPLFISASGSQSLQPLNNTSLTFNSNTGALGATTYEIGGNTDTTLSRASAGVLAVEGVNVLTTATGLPLSGGTMSGNITLGENTSIALDPAGSADGKYSGITVTGTGGATIAFGDLVTLDKDDSRWELVDISVAAAATGDARGILGMAVTSSTDGTAVTVLLHGIIRADANFPTLTIGAPVYASTTGDIVVTQPTTTDYVIRQVGFGLTADELYFSPTQTWVTHT